MDALDWELTLNVCERETVYIVDISNILHYKEALSESLCSQ